MGWFCINHTERSYEEHESKSTFERIPITIFFNVTHAIQSPGLYQYETHLRESRERNLCCNACLLAPPTFLQLPFSYFQALLKVHAT